MRVISRTTFFFLLFVFVLAGSAMVMIYRIIADQQIYHAVLPRPQSQKEVKVLEIETLDYEIQDVNVTEEVIEP